MVIPSLDDIKLAVSIICEPGKVYELRALDTAKGTVSGCYDDFEALASAAFACSAVTYYDEFERIKPGLVAGGVFITLNPIQPDLLARSHNCATPYAKHTTADRDIIRRRWLMIDCDPKRPSGISANDAEHEAALARALVVRDYLINQRWPLPAIMADSGNGAHLLYRIDLPNDDAATDLLRRVLEVLDVKFSDNLVGIDKTTFNAARICKLPGTVARKGSNMPDRAHRIAKILELGD